MKAVHALQDTAEHTLILPTNLERIMKYNKYRAS
jgi:hypothetical protein